ncbi:MAG: flagellar motor switch protein FliM [Verrucomicrobia bacterium]|nr:MAG: flagellar motor switch protein FliM [Verrucomicrobiota bacterium]
MPDPEQEKKPSVPGGSNPAQELTQEEIDQLLAASQAAANSVGGNGPIFDCRGNRFDRTNPPRVEPYDFSNPTVLEEHLLRILRQRHGEFADLLAARLSLYLRLDVTLELQSVSTQVYRRFAASVRNPSHVVLFKLEPLNGVGVLEIAPTLGLAFVDRMLGGKGESDPDATALTEIEMNLLDDVLLVFLEEWARIWGSETPLTPSLLGRESGGRYLQTSASDTIMLVAVFDGTAGSSTERIQVAIPFPSIEHLVRGMSALLPAPEDEKPEHSTEWRPIYNNIPIPLSVEWDACELTVKEILDLKPGQVIRLPRQIISDTRVRLGDVSRFTGEIGVDGDHLAVRIDKTTSQEDV